MKKDIKKYKAQSILEYVLVMSGLVALILLNTIAFRIGLVNNAPVSLEAGIQDALGNAQALIEDNLRTDYAGEVVDLVTAPQYDLRNPGYEPDPNLGENLRFQEEHNPEYYFGEGEPYTIGGIPIEEFPNGGQVR
jgi:hypothetical protein